MIHQIDRKHQHALLSPSGAGKTTLVKHLLGVRKDLAFSVSATSREKRSNETDGKDYYFIGVEGFKSKIEADAFAEWEEVYADQFYGTLKSEIERIWALGKCIIFDIDVIGAMNLKKIYGSTAQIVFVMAPSKEILFQRLRDRNTESEASLQKRIQKADQELQYSQDFDVVLINDELDIAKQDAIKIASSFLE